MTLNVPVAADATRPGRWRLEITATRALMLIALAIAMGAVFVSSGLFSVDETIYIAGSRALIQNHGFSVWNAWREWGSNDLRLWLLVEGRGGELVPQYPPGESVLGAPLYALIGNRGPMLVNVVAGIGTIFALHRLARGWFADETAALVAIAMLIGASFWLEYVYAVWPHSVAVLCITLALIWIRPALDAEAGFERKAMAAGAAIGCAMLFRTDAVIAMAALGAVALLFARRPFHLPICLAIGFAPFLAIASLTNLAKFGTLNPLSYGQQGNVATSLSAHLTTLAAFALAGFALVALRLTAWRPDRRVLMTGAIILVVAILAVAPLRHFATSYLTGAWALLADSTTIPETQRGLTPIEGGPVAFFGLWKKALGQSLPWLGMLALLVAPGTDAKLRKSQLVVLVFAGVLTLPFCMRAWHGGMGSNMRYFLPLLPPLCALGARLLVDLLHSVPDGARPLRLGAMAGGALVLGWALAMPTKMPGAEQILSTWLLLAVTAACLAVALPWRGAGAARPLALAAIGAGLAASLIYAARDFAQSQTLRAEGARTERALATLPERSLLYVSARFVAGWAFRPGHVAALPSDTTGALNHGLIDRALAEGYHVYVWPDFVTDDLGASYSLQATSWPGSGDIRLKEVTAPVPPALPGARTPR